MTTTNSDGTGRGIESPAVTLAGFLLARIAEDEAMAPTMADAREGSRIGEKSHWTPRRALADIEAKRRIVARLAPITEADLGCACDRCETLRDLALPYAGHPDYRQEWKS